VATKTLLVEPKLDAQASKRVAGRPMKTPPRGKRAPLSLFVRPQIKRLVDRLATENGVTQSAQGEFLIQQGIVVQQVLDALGKTLQEVERGDPKAVKAALWRLGYRPRREWIGGKVWTSWCEPGHPRADEIDPGTPSDEQGEAQ
jgi:hypothetical protein